MGLAAPALRALLRTGDTPSSARAAMIKRPPHLLVTTPESLYLLVTAAKSRERLRSVRAVIVDEIHAVARDKRGAHLALTLERLDALCERRPQRIGLSATQRPIETIARLLVGAGTGGRGPTAPRRAGSSTSGIGARSTWPSSCRRRRSRPSRRTSSGARSSTASPGTSPQHRTTLVFVNTRRLAERLAHLLAERVGEDRVAAHHGSLSKDRRLTLEARLRAGDLKVARRDGLARAGHRHRSRRARLPDRLAAEPRDVPAAGRALGPRAGRHAEGPPLSDHARRAGRERGAPARRARGPARPRPAAGGAARHPRPADRGRLRRRGLARGRSLRAGAPGRALRRPGPRGLRRRGRDARRRHPDRPRPAGRLAPSRPRQRRAARAARRADRRPDLGRRHSGDGGLQGGRRSRRHRGRHGERGLGHREHGRRHLPPRQHVVAHSPRRGRRRARGRRAGRAALGAVLARRSARAHRRAVGRGRRSPRARRRLPRRARRAGRAGVARARVRPRRRRRRGDRRLSRRGAARPRRAARPSRTWSSSASSTRRAGCSS